jgi:8-oxo-dGTP pyrophosphatase MutT (NUDIX family)
MSSIESRSESILAADDLPQRLAQAIGDGSRGSAARVRMSPELSYGRHAGPAPFSARPAAVVLLLFRRDHAPGGAGRWHLPLTERPASLARHAGQISLPGGAVERGENSTQAAIRELSEELGIDRGVEILGRLADCYVFASDFLITPWVAATRVEPAWRPHDREVQRVVELPLDALLDKRSFSQLTIARGPLEFNAPCIQVHKVCIWGATSVILAELAHVLRELSNLQLEPPLAL